MIILKEIRIVFIIYVNHCFPVCLCENYGLNNLLFCSCMYSVVGCTCVVLDTLSVATTKQSFGSV